MFQEELAISHLPETYHRKSKELAFLRVAGKLMWKRKQDNSVPWQHGLLEIHTSVQSSHVMYIYLDLIV